MVYNGWTNKETWLVSLWLGDMFQADLDDGQEIDESYIESVVDEMASAALEEGANGFMTDLLNCALSEINYREIAEQYESESV